MEAAQDDSAPDTIETRIGTLRFKDGAPDEATVKKVYKAWKPGDFELVG